MHLTLYEGSLSPGEKVTVVLGDKTHCSPGIRAQTYVESAFETFVLIDPTNATDPRPIEDRLIIPVVAAKTHHLACVVPSQTAVNQPVNIFVKGEDRWRNPTATPDDLRFEWVGSGVVTITNSQLVAQTAGTSYIRSPWR